MTREQRIEAIINFRFTERQARFLDLVMRHGGVCVPRQYARFAGVANGGDKCNEFFQKLVFRGRAARVDCVHNRAGLYHVHHRRLYEAIGEGKSRFRRAIAPRQTIERLMLLDAVLAAPDLEWLTTQAEKLAHVARGNPNEAADTAADATPKTPPQLGLEAKRLPGHVPIGIEADGRAVLLYLVLQPWTDAFRTWLQGHAAWLQRVPQWTIRVVFPRPLDRAYNAHQRVIREELETPLTSWTVHELKWYFQHRKTAGTSIDDLTRRFLASGANAFSTPRFDSLYRRWLKRGDRVFDELTSMVFADALTSGAGRVESLVLPHSYRHLAPAAVPDPGPVKSVEKGDETRDETLPRSQPPPLTPAPEELTVPDQCARDWARLVEAHRNCPHPNQL